MVEGAHRNALVELIRQHDNSPAVGAEIGVHKGRTSGLLLKTFPNLRLYMVDSWVWQEGAEDAAFANTSFAGDRIQMLKGDSVKMAREVMDGLDFVFIDGDHTKAGCLRDMMAYWPKVREGGLFCGHDYRKPDFPGVDEAVAAFAEMHGVEFQGTEVGHIWWTKKTSS